MRGADVSSDQHLLMTTVRLFLKRFTNANTDGQSTMFDCSETRTHKQLSRSTFQTGSSDCKSSGMTHVIRSLARRRHSTRNGSLTTPERERKERKTVLNNRERKTVLNNSRTRAAKAKAQEVYTAADREVKRSIKKDKRDCIDDLARQAETAAGQGNLRDLYLVTKKLTGKFQ